MCRALRTLRRAHSRVPRKHSDANVFPTETKSNRFETRVLRSKCTFFETAPNFGNFFFEIALVTKMKKYASLYRRHYIYYYNERRRDVNIGNVEF